MSEDLKPLSSSLKDAPAEVILARAALLRGRVLGELATASKNHRLESPRDKGAVGKLIQLHFGLEAEDTREEPDFAAARMELKIVPVWVSKGPEYTAKEATSVSMIQYMTLPSEEWPTASVRKKLDRILFVFYEHSLVLPRKEWPILGVLDWSADGQTRSIMERDWKAVHQRVIDGKAHELSEKQSTFLSARTKSADGERRRPQPFSDIPAKPRAWALKTSLTTGVATRLLSVPEHLGRLIVAPKGPDPEAVAEATVVAARKFTGHRLDSIAKSLRVAIPGGKSGHVTLLRRALGHNKGQAGIKEWMESGVRLCVIRCGADGLPYQHTSLPTFDWMDFLDTPWEESELFEQIRHIVFLPLLDRKDEQPYDQVVVGEAFHWTPNPNELATIEDEYEMFRGEVIRGLAYGGLTKESRTKIIHVRQHAAKASVVSDAPDGASGTKKATISSFWFNRKFLQPLLLTSVSWPPKRVD